MSALGSLLLLLIVGVPLTIVLTAPLFGMRRSKEGAPLVDRQALAVLGCVAVAYGSIFLVGSSGDATTAGRLHAALWGAIGAIAVPGVVYFALGHLLARSPRLLGLVFAVLLIPAGFYLVVVLLFAVRDSSCPPDAYECPF